MRQGSQDRRRSGLLELAVVRHVAIRGPQDRLLAVERPPTKTTPAVSCFRRSAIRAGIPGVFFHWLAAATGPPNPPGCGLAFE